MAQFWKPVSSSNQYGPRPLIVTGTNMMLDVTWVLTLARGSACFFAGPAQLATRAIPSAPTQKRESLMLRPFPFRILMGGEYSPGLNAPRRRRSWIDREQVLPRRFVRDKAPPRTPLETLADVIHPFPAFNRVLGESLGRLALMTRARSMARV